MTKGLRGLIEVRKHAMAMSYGDIAERGGMSRSTVHRLATTPLSRLPERETLESLALALDVSLDVVMEAAAEETGYAVQEVSLSSDPATRVIIASLEQLTQDQRENVARMVEGLAKASAPPPVDDATT